jgi:NodT family efflux transporter outer membrane factor (OMF) lipoprotein
MRRRALVVVLLTPWVAACVVGPRYAVPKVVMPPTWAEAPASAANADRATLERWWTVFHDPLLEDLVGRAVDGNLDLKIARSRVREARAARGIAVSAGLPQVDVNGHYVRSERSDAVPPFKSTAGGSSPFGPRAQNAFEVGFDMGWELDLFGGVKRDVEAAVAQVQAAEETERDVLVTLLGDVARNYAELRGTQRQLAILEATVQSQRDTLDLAKARFDAGLGTALDVERAEGLVAATTSRHPELERLARHSIYRLGVLLGREPAALASVLETPKPIPPQPPELPGALPSELLSRRPDLRRAEREVAAATARLDVARADLFPRFSITGNFGRRSEDVSDLGSSASQLWSLVPGVRWPILSGGRIRANIQIHDARQEQALRQYERTVLIAVEEVENALSARSREQRRLEALRASVAASRRALDLATDRYTSGLENFLSVLDAQRALYSAEDGLAQSETNAMVSLIGVYKALGGGWALGATPSTPSDADAAAGSRKEGSQ